MATITEDYVSYEIAKLLKEKGFNEPCWCYWNFSQEEYPTFLQYRHRNSDDDLEEKPTAPTLQMAMKWLREVHDCSIEITSSGYLMDNDATWECDIKVGHRLYFRHITGEKSFESCAEAAIKYCLEHLI